MPPEHRIDHPSGDSAQDAGATADYRTEPSPSLRSARSLHMTLPSAVRPATAAVLTLLLTAPVALAAPGVAGTGEDTPLGLPADTGPSQASSAAPGGGSLVRTIVGLAVVIGVIYGLGWVLRQVKASREERTHGHGLRPAATIALGPNRSLHLVHAGRELVLVGVAEHGVTPIRTYSEDEALELGLIDALQDGPDAAGPAGSAGLPGTALARRPSVQVGGAIDALRRWTQR